MLLIGRENCCAIPQCRHAEECQPEAFDLLGGFPANTLRGDDLEGFRAKLAQDIHLLEERYCEARTVDSSLFRRLGLTDAAIARLACEDLLVLTDDLPLAGALEKAQIDVLNFNQLRPLAWS